MRLDPACEGLTYEDWHNDLYGPNLERPAPYCDGPGPLWAPDPDRYDRTPGDVDRKIEECPACDGRKLNHHNHRRTTMPEEGAA